MNLTLRIHDPSGSVRRDVRLTTPDGASVFDMTDALIELFGWPRETMDGDAVTYGLRRLGERETLDAALDLSAVGLMHGDALVLGPIRDDENVK